MASKNRMKRTIVIGASPNPDRYAYKAVLALDIEGHEVYPIGIREGQINGIDIIITRPRVKNVDTVTIYLSKEHQPLEYDYILGLKPKRVIFNPGAENEEFNQMAIKKGIITEHACTLVLLRTSQY